MGGENVMSSATRAVRGSLTRGRFRAAGKVPVRVRSPPPVQAASSRSFASVASGLSGPVAQGMFFPRPFFSNNEKDDEGWIDVATGEEAVEENIERFVFGGVPTREEVEDAVSLIQQIIVPVTLSSDPGDDLPCYLEHVQVGEETALEVKSSGSSPELLSGSESDWVEPPMYLQSSVSTLSSEQRRVYDAFRQLQTDSHIQKAVMSLSSDRAVWDAVMKNEVVMEIKKSFQEGQLKGKEPSEGTGSAADALSGLIGDMRKKVVEFVDNIAKLIHNFFRSEREDEADFFGNFISSSFMLSVVVFVVVVVTRNQKSL